MREDRKVREGRRSRYGSLVEHRLEEGCEGAQNNKCGSWWRAYTQKGVRGGTEHQMWVVRGAQTRNGVRGGTVCVCVCVERKKEIE